MKRLARVIHELGGIAKRAELLQNGVDRDELDVAAWYQWHIVRVRRGWYASPGEDPAVMRAWRVGGRLTCVSALAHHQRAQHGPVLHVEIPAGSSRLRDPDDMRRALGPEARVVLHWAREPGPGDRRAVTAAHAAAIASVCGVSAGNSRARAAVSSASRID